MKGEGYALFGGVEKIIAAGIRQGIEVLKNLADKPNTRLQKLVEWAHTFVEASSLKAEPIRNYWLELLH